MQSCHMNLERQLKSTFTTDTSEETETLQKFFSPFRIFFIFTSPKSDFLQNGENLNTSFFQVFTFRLGIFLDSWGTAHISCSNSIILTAILHVSAIQSEM